jgi:hypothetical protein
MKLKLSLLAAVLAVAASAAVAVATPSAQAKRGGSLAVSADGTLHGSTTAVTGMFKISKFQVINGVLTAVGTYTGSLSTAPTPATAAVKSINGTSLGGSSSAAAPAAAAATCDILDLVLGPLHLDLLGLVVDLNQVHLQITAEQGQGNLLGNLLCAVAGLLDNTGGAGGGLNGLLQTIANLLNQILGALQL